MYKIIEQHQKDFTKKKNMIWVILFCAFICLFIAHVSKVYLVTFAVITSFSLPPLFAAEFSNGYSKPSKKNKGKTKSRQEIAMDQLFWTWPRLVAFSEAIIEKTGGYVFFLTKSLSNILRNCPPRKEIGDITPTTFMHH